LRLVVCWRDLSVVLPGGQPIFKVCIGVQIDKDCKFLPWWAATLMRVVPILTVDYTGTWILILEISIIRLDSHNHFIVNYDPIPL
jgi:hypothetical protein